MVSRVSAGVATRADSSLRRRASTSIKSSVSATTFEDVTATLQQWGDVHGLTDVVHDTHEDPVLQKEMMLSGQQVANGNAAGPGVDDAAGKAADQPSKVES